MTRLLALIALLALAAPATAHVEVFPTTVPIGEPTTFTIRVPNEAGPDGPRATTGVRVTFPDSITVFSFRSPGSGFSITPLISASNELNGVDYRGGRFVGERTFEDFELVGTAQEAGQAVWRVEQLLDDGTSVLWTGPPEGDGDATGEPEADGPGPAPAIDVVASGESVDESTAGGGGGGDSGAALWLALIAAGLAGAALLLGGFLWSSRPMDLPEDGGTS